MGDGLKGDENIDLEKYEWLKFECDLVQGQKSIFKVYKIEDWRSIECHFECEYYVKMKAFDCWGSICKL